MPDAPGSLRLTRAECPDEQILVAFLDGVLFSADRALVADHVASCSACEARLAAIQPVPQQPLDDNAGSLRPALVGRSRKWLPAIAGGGALALGLWLLLRPAPEQFDEERVASEATRPERPPATDTPAQTPAAISPDGAIATQAEAVSPPPLSPPSASEPPVTTVPPAATPVAAAATASAAASTPVRPPASPPASPPTPPAAVAPALRALSIASPDMNVRWRIDGSLIEYSTDGGKKWNRQRIAVAAATVAGDAPAATVCWLVGRAGTVLITTDGLTWRAAQAPDSVDLLSVAAMDGFNATAVAVDGRRFTTADGGASWFTSQ